MQLNLWTLQVRVEGFLCLVWAHSVHSFSTWVALWNSPVPSAPGSLCSNHSCTLTTLDSAWVTAQPQCQVRVHQTPYQMGRLSRSPSVVHRLLCSLWTWVCFCLWTKQQVWCFSGLSAASPGEQASVQSPPGSTCTSAETSRASFCLEEGQNFDLFWDIKHLH